MQGTLIRCYDGTDEQCLMPYDIAAEEDPHGINQYGASHVQTLSPIISSCSRYREIASSSCAMNQGLHAIRALTETIADSLLLVAIFDSFWGIVSVARLLLPLSAHWRETKVPLGNLCAERIPVDPSVHVGSYTTALACLGLPDECRPFEGNNWSGWARQNCGCCPQASIEVIACECPGI